MQQARFVARRITDHVQGGNANAAFEYHDKGIMATIGRSRAVAQAGRFHMTGLVAWLAWLFVHIWYLVGFRNRFIVLFNWAWNYLTYKRGARLITGGHAWEGAIKLAGQAENPTAAVKAEPPRATGT
jgi:NADH:ubiquinone reductase (H+-translocating)